LIRDIEEMTSSYHENGALKPGISEDFIKHELVALSTKWGVVCSATSIVCVELNRREATVSSMEIEDGPLNNNSYIPNMLRPATTTNRRDEDRGRTKSRNADYRPRYRERSCSRSDSEDEGWKPRNRSRSPVKWGSNARTSSSPPRRRSSRRSSISSDSDDSGSYSPPPLRNISRSRSRSRSPRPTQVKRKGLFSGISNFFSRERDDSRDRDRGRRRSISPSIKKDTNKKKEKKAKKVVKEKKIETTSSSKSLSQDNFYQLVNLQGLDGTWKLTEKLAQATAIAFNTLTEMANKLQQEFKINDTIAATLIAIAVLETHFQGTILHT
jgi:hypothetical protein